METIKTAALSISAKADGAELTSIASLHTGIEYLWQASPEIWPRHAPVLFPIVGKPAKVYEIEGQDCALSQHGFARDQRFSIVKHSDNELVYRLTENEKTLQVYPYSFQFEIGYKVEGNMLLTTYTVHNTDSRKIWFSVGAHPAFNCPLLPSETFEDYYIAFEKVEPVEKHLLENGLLNGKTASVLHGDSNILPLSLELFLEDALVLKHIASKSMVLKSRKSAHYVQMDFEGFPFFGIWTKPGTNRFVCLEPWMGIADTFGKNVPFQEKEGILSLESGQSFNCSFTLVFG